MGKLERRIKRPPAWTPFELRPLNPIQEPDIDGALKAFPQMTREQVIATYEQVAKDIVFVNSRYQVNVRQTEDGIAHLSIKRLDKDRVGPERYRDFMRIKDELLGPESEAVELYPARSREVDTANQYHLWAYSDPNKRFPFGFDHGRTVTGPTNIGASRQHPFDEDHHK